jgi:ABC-type transport system involved in multi-copper enzyme maturation permease subunit
VLLSRGADTLLYTILRRDLETMRGLLGFFVTLVAVRAIALEYEQGTIRVLLARGVGRLRLLGAKVVAAALVGLGALVAAVVLLIVGTLFVVAVGAGSLAPLGALPSRIYPGVLTFLATIAVSMAATLLFAVALAVIGRNQAFALAVILPYWFVETIAGGLLYHLGLATDIGALLNVPEYLLGQNLIAMPDLLVSPQTLGQPVFSATDPAAVVRIDGTYTLLVTLAYCLVFAAVAILVSRRRDVLE